MIGLDTTILVQLEILELPLHTRAWQALHREVRAGGEELAIAPQIIAEFLHVVTDGGRFARPLGMDQAVERALHWWNASEVRQVREKLGEETGKASIDSPILPNGSRSSSRTSQGWRR